MFGKVYCAMCKLDRLIASKVGLYLMVLFAHLGRPRGAALATPIPAGGTGASSSSSSTSLAWHSPCVGRAPPDLADDDDLPGPTRPLSQIYADIATNADQSKTAVYGIMQKYIMERFHDPLYAAQIAQFNIQGLPQTTSVDQLTQADFDHDNVDVKASIQRTYDDLSRVAVFLEEAILDEIAYEVDYNSNIHEELQSIQRHHIISTLCHLQSAMLAHQDTIDFTITRQVMEQETRDLTDRALRQTRDYIVLRELHKVFHALRVEFTVLKLNENSKR